MATKKTVRETELENAIAEATAILDESDASRVALQEAFDSAREVLSDAFGVGFEKAVEEYYGDEETSEDDDSD